MSPSISAASLYAQLGLPSAPTVIDARTEEDYQALPRLIPGARRYHPEQIALWGKSLPRSQAVVVLCTSASQSIVITLTALGYRASYLDGGMEAWLAAALPTIRSRPEIKVPGASRWVTRARPKIDRLACPWLVRRFIDPDALFFYTPAERVRSESLLLDAQPYDIDDVTFSHRGPRCSFDAFLDEFDLHDRVLDEVATIVRAADTGDLPASPQAPGLLAISLGMSATHSDDFTLLDRAMGMYDALYAWCKTARDETHSWPKKTY